MKCLIKNIKIKAIATYLPTNILEMSSLASIYGTKEVENIIKNTGVERVHYASENETSSDLCFNAARHLIMNEKIQPEEIDGLVFISQTPDYRMPASSVILQDRLGLSIDTVCFDISYGCSGYIYGLFQASLLINTGACKNVLVLAGDTTTKLINPKDRAQRMVFGDCGSATLVTKGDTELGFHICSDGSGFDKVIIPAGGFRTPSSDKTRLEILDEDGNIRSQENLYMDGLSVFTFIVNSGQKSIKEILEYMQWEKDQVDFFALHQGTGITINYLCKKLGLDSNKAPINIINYGNTGPTTIPLILCDMKNQKSDNKKHAMEKIIMSAYGVGFSWGSIACNLNDTNIYVPINK